MSENQLYRSADFIQTVLQYTDPGVIFIYSLERGKRGKKKEKLRILSKLFKSI